ncbi:hypothetical protein GE09DRAFT_1227246 [Coniochaeta sp. 2T2.1]|nr:hypothetical protein GE09DRAFT_1227246 [Coniochaeta sp. 2T2.1]
MATDTMLNVDSGTDDIFYRIQRVSGASKRVVYVKVTNADAIPEDDRTYGPDAMAQLSKLKEWSDHAWTTLLVHKDDEKGVWCEADVFLPPSVPRDDLLCDKYPTYDLFTLSLTRELGRFPREAEWVARELRGYHALAGSPLAPKLLGYVSEQPASPDMDDRVVGFLIEKVDGRHAEPEDLEPCRRDLDQLHRHLIHGDLAKYNILITTDGPKFIDFEVSIPVGTKWWSVRLRDEERETLAVKPADTTGACRPW